MRMNSKSRRRISGSMRPLRNSLLSIALLTLVSCAVQRPLAVPCPALPPRPAVALPELGHFHKTLDSILENEPTPKSPTSATR